MSNYKVQSNLKHNGKLYAKGETVNLNEDEAKVLLKDSIIVSLGEETVEEEISVQPAVNKVTHENNEANGEATVEAGAETDVLPEDEKEQTEVKTKYKVLKGVEFPRGTVHKVGEVIELTEEQSAKFTDGLIERLPEDNL